MADIVPDESDGDDCGGVAGEDSVEGSGFTEPVDGDMLCSRCCFLSILGPVTSRKDRSSACVRIIAA